MEEDTKTPQSSQEIKKGDRKEDKGFPESLTNAVYMLQLSGKPSVLPSFGGEKGFVPSQAQHEKAAKYYDELSCILGEERVCKIGSLSQGRWEPTRKLIVVEKAVGSLWQRFGTNVGGRLYVLPEEGLFLIEQGVFELYLGDLPLSVEESWSLLLVNLPSPEYYTVFAFLCRQGFAIVSSRKHEYFLDGGFNVCRDSDVRHSIKEEMGIFHRTSLEEYFSLDPHSYSPSSSVQKGDNLSSKAFAQFETFINEGRENSKQTKALEVCGIDTLGENTERSAEDDRYGVPMASMGDHDELAFKSKDNMPLVLPGDAVFPKAMMKKLQIIQRRAVGSRSRILRIVPVSTCEPFSFAREELETSGGTNEKEEKEASKASEAVDSKKAPLKPQEVQSKMEQTFETSTEVGFTSNAATLGGAQGQVPFSASASKETRKPCKQLYFFDLYHRTTNFKKSAPGPADCRIFPCSYRELPTDLKELENVFDCSRNIPVKFGLCEQGSVTFYSMIRTDVSVVLKNEEIE